MGAYDTLSYCWVHGHVKVLIGVDGLRFEVIGNLHAALKRTGARTRRISIDVICVQQDKIEERDG